MKGVSPEDSLRKEVGMRRLIAVLSCLVLVILVAVAAVCGVVGLPETPMEAGLTLAEVAPEFAECPLGATALDAEHLTIDIACERCPVGLESNGETRRTAAIYSGGSERLKRPSTGLVSVDYSGVNRRAKLGVWRGGVHVVRG